jgi:hypothetical protein
MLPFLTANGIELGFLRYVISIIYTVSIVKSISSFEIILNNDGIRRKYTIYFFYYPIYEENFLAHWNKISRISYANFAFNINSTEKTFHITFGLTNYREGIAYIVKKMNNGVIKIVVLESLEYCDTTTAHKLEKMGILETKEGFRAKMEAQRRAKKRKSFSR